MQSNEGILWLEEDAEFSIKKINISLEMLLQDINAEDIIKYFSI